jgi:hypothetical protein
MKEAANHLKEIAGTRENYTLQKIDLAACSVVSV